ncbi:MAG TPA: UvrD-helicase domain-containing protein [Longimicrobiales bacterium]
MKAEQTDLFAQPSLPRDLILASAGSGKTFRISSTIITLLARGGDPDEVLASTFTRKAAGEILDRVLVRLAAAALSEEKAAELAEHAGPTSHDGTSVQCDSAFWMRVLERVVRDLHRMNIGTLDAFFLRTALSFSHELGLPGTWTISDESTGDRIRSLALQDVLRHTDRQVLLELVRSIARNTGTRSIHEQLLRKVRLLTAIHYALDPRVDDHWSGFDRVVRNRPEDTIQRAAELARRFEAAPLPHGKTTGAPIKTFVTNVESIVRLLRDCQWEELAKNTLVKRARDDMPLLNRAEIPEALCDLVEEAVGIARLEIAHRMSLRSHALGRLAALYAEALDRRRAALGVYEFDDVTRFLGGIDPLGLRPDMYYRLDAHARHILLDEFQDTSVPQWEALAPLADELMSGHEDERAAVIVADQKQSIYGWRGGSPDLVTHLRSKYHLRDEQLTRSWRSSAVVLDFVNDVYERFADQDTWFGDLEYASVAQEWVKAFASHSPARDLPGHVLVRVGPEDDEPGEARPKLVKYAAEHVAELHRRMPGFSIGVLTRTNATVARMMLNLKNLGVHASEEGGNPLSDAAPVTAVLALLRLCDHPANAVARYHVAMSPLGAVVGLTDHLDLALAGEVAHRYRTMLLADGYGDTIAHIAAQLAGACDDRERRRLSQLVELAFRFEDTATLRPSDFVRYVQRERVEDPVAADVRVMTIHQSKGLEFDIVVLPELDAPFVQSRYSEVLAYRPEPGARITRAFPFVAKDTLKLFEEDELTELRAASAQAFSNELRDGLSTMYVALTRARCALHIIVKPAKATSESKTGARILRQALRPGAEAAPFQTLIERGDPEWYRTATPQRTSPTAASTVAPLALRSDDVRSRSLTRRSPSELEGGGRTDLSMVLRLTGTVATRRGSIAHLWLEQIEWLDPRTPLDDATLTALARQIDPDVPDDDVTELIASFRTWTADSAIARLLSSSAWPDGSSVHREVPFLVREGNTIIEGFIDRLIITRAGGAVRSAAVIDFKTDAIEAGDRRTLDARTEHYRPQVDAYRRAVAAMHGISLDTVQGHLVFLDPGTVAACS